MSPLLLSLLILFPLFAASTPVPLAADSSIGATLALGLQARNSINDCKDSSFQSDTSEGSPLVADCQHLATNIQGGGTWTFQSGGTQFQLAQYGTCAFGVTTACLPHYCPAGGILVNIGNQDIIDVISTSITRFASADGKVGSNGTMECQEAGDEHDIAVWWGLYHNP